MANSKPLTGFAAGAERHSKVNGRLFPSGCQRHWRRRVNDSLPLPRFMQRVQPVKKLTNRPA